MTERPELWLEDLAVGQVWESPAREVTADEIVAFARDYDPQPFHLDPEAGERSVFGGLVASGWHTSAMTMRLFVDHGPRIAGGLVGLGLEELRWGPLRPGERIRLRCEVLSVRPSRSRPDRGLVRLAWTTLTEDGREVQHGIPTLLVPARGNGAGDP